MRSYGMNGNRPHSAFSNRRFQLRSGTLQQHSNGSNLHAARPISASVTALGSRRADPTLSNEVEQNRRISHTRSQSRQRKRTNRGNLHSLYDQKVHEELSGIGRMRRIEEELKLLNVEQKKRSLLHHGADGTVRIDARAVHERVRVEREDAWYFRHTDTHARVSHQSERIPAFLVPEVERFQLQYGNTAEEEEAAHRDAVPSLMSHFIRSNDEHQARRRASLECTTSPRRNEKLQEQSDLVNRSAPRRASTIGGIAGDGITTQQATSAAAAAVAAVNIFEAAI